MGEECKNEIQNLKQKLEKDFPGCLIQIFYDKLNVENNTFSLNNILRQFMDIVTILCLYKPDIDLYVRIHIYKQWTVFRIASDFIFPQELIDVLYERRSKGGINLFDISKDYDKSVIKMAFSIVSCS